MVGRRCGRIASVVCRYDKNIVFLHQFKNFSEPLVKFRHSTCITRNVISVSVNHIKIDKIYKAKTVKVTLHNSIKLIHSVGVAYRGIAFRKSDTCKNIVYFAYGYCIKSVILKQRGNCIRWRDKRKVVASGRTLEGMNTLKWTCNYTADTVLTLKHFTSNLAVFIKRFYRHNVLMCGDLKYAVSRRVNDKLACFYVFFAKVTYNICTRIGFVAKRTSACELFKFFYHLSGKSVGIGRERLFRTNSRNFPMAYRCVLAERCFVHSCIRSRGHWGFFTLYAFDVEKSELCKIGAVEFGMLTYCAQCIASFIIPDVGIRHFADAHTVKNDEKSTFVIFFHKSIA